MNIFDEFIAMTSWWARLRLKSPASQFFTQSLFRCRSKKTSKLRVTGLCAGNSPVHRVPVNSPHKWPVTRKMFPFDDVIMCITNLMCFLHAAPSDGCCPEPEHNGRWATSSSPIFRVTNPLGTLPKLTSIAMALLCYLRCSDTKQLLHKRTHWKMGKLGPCLRWLCHNWTLLLWHQWTGLLAISGILGGISNRTRIMDPVMNQNLIIPLTQRSWSGVYWFHSVCLSIRLSVRLWTELYPLCIFYNTW